MGQNGAKADDLTAPVPTRLGPTTATKMASAKNQWLDKLEVALDTNRKVLFLGEATYNLVRLSSPSPIRPLSRTMPNGAGPPSDI